MQKGSGTSALVAVERRLGAEVESALKKRGPTEGKVAGVARALAPHSAAVRTQLLAVAKELGKQEGFDRELFGAALRTLAEVGEKRVGPIVASALKTEEHGGLAALSAACFLEDGGIGPSLARAAASTKTQIAFAAEVARLCRGEPTGSRLASLAPRIKEAHRIALCIDLFLPLSLHLERVEVKACAGVAEAIHVLCGSERHLGRWLVMAEVAHRGKDARPLREAVERTTTGPDSSRAAWSLVAWALEPGRGTGATRPTSELVARLSHRPSADRDTSFLFRLADAKIEAARPMLEALVRTRPLGDDVALRAAAALTQSYERSAFARDTIDAAERSERPELRGLAAAVLWDLGERPRAVAVADGLATSDDLTALGWAALVHAAAGAPAARQPARLVREPAFRRIHWGWVE